MQSRRVSWAVLFLLILGGCPKSTPAPPNSPSPYSTHDAVVAAAVTSMRTTADALNRVQDARSAQQATDVVRSETQNLRQLRQRLGELGRGSAADRARVKQQSQDVVRASQAIQQATAAAAGKAQPNQMPQNVAVPLLTAMDDYGAAMQEFAQQASPLMD